MSMDNVHSYIDDMRLDVIEDIVEELDGIIPMTLKLESEEMILCSRAMKDGLLFNQFGDMLNGEE